MFYRIAVLKTFAKFKRKHLIRILFTERKDSDADVFWLILRDIEDVYGGPSLPIKINKK